MLRTLAITVALGGALPCQPAAAQQKITIDGSTGTAPLIEALGKAFTAKTNIAVEIGKGLGTKDRLTALADRKIDIAMASHGLNVAEVTARGMAVNRIAMTPVVLACMKWQKLKTCPTHNFVPSLAAAQRIGGSSVRRTLPSHRWRGRILRLMPKSRAPEWDA